MYFLHCLLYAKVFQIVSNVEENIPFVLVKAIQGPFRLKLR